MPEKSDNSYESLTLFAPHLKSNILILRILSGSEHSLTLSGSVLESRTMLHHDIEQSFTQICFSPRGGSSPADLNTQDLNPSYAAVTKAIKQRSLPTTKVSQIEHALNGCDAPLLEIIREDVFGKILKRDPAIHPASAAKVASLVAGKLEQDQVLTFANEASDILNEVIERFGRNLLGQTTHEDLQRKIHLGQEEEHATTCRKERLHECGCLLIALDELATLLPDEAHRVKALVANHQDHVALGFKYPQTLPVLNIIEETSCFTSQVRNKAIIADFHEALRSCKPEEIRYLLLRILNGVLSDNTNANLGQYMVASGRVAKEAQILGLDVYLNEMADRMEGQAELLLAKLDSDHQGLRTQHFSRYGEEAKKFETFKKHAAHRLKQAFALFSVYGYITSRISSEDGKIKRGDYLHNKLHEVQNALPKAGVIRGLGALAYAIKGPDKIIYFDQAKAYCVGGDFELTPIWQKVIEGFPGALKKLELPEPKVRYAYVSMLEDFLQGNDAQLRNIAFAKLLALAKTLERGFVTEYSSQVDLITKGNLKHPLSQYRHWRTDELVSKFPEEALPNILWYLSQVVEYAKDPADVLPHALEHIKLNAAYQEVEQRVALKVPPLEQSLRCVIKAAQRTANIWSDGVRINGAEQIVNLLESEMEQALSKKRLEPAASFALTIVRCLSRIQTEQRWMMIDKLMRNELDCAALIASVPKGKQDEVLSFFKERGYQG